MACDADSCAWLKNSRHMATVDRTAETKAAQTAPDDQSRPPKVAPEIRSVYRGLDAAAGVWIDDDDAGQFNGDGGFLLDGEHGPDREPALRQHRHDHTAIGLARQTVGSNRHDRPVKVFAIGAMRARCRLYRRRGQAGAGCQ